MAWTYITDVDATAQGEICFQNEAFCGLFSETAVEADSPEAFLEKAVAFANERLWGNLTATLVVHPASMKEPKTAAAVEQAIADLRYGMVLVNQFAGLGYLIESITWGAFPGNDIYDIQSGIDVTSNTLMFDRPQKSVVRSTFVTRPDPFRLDSRTALDVARRLAEMQYRPRLRQLPGFLWSALRS